MMDDKSSKSSKSFKQMKKLIYSASAFALTALPVLAQEAGGEAASEQIISGAETALKGLLDSAGPVVASVVIAGLGIWGAIAIVGLIKRAFNAGKGR